MSTSQNIVTHAGSCHCGAISFKFQAPDTPDITDCNCTICSKKGYLHLIVPQSDFTLLSGKDNLSTYTFGTHIAKHYFCKTCGISSFYIPRSHPDGYSVNLRCVEPGTIKSTNTIKFDGRDNWEADAERLRNQS